MAASLLSRIGIISLFYLFFSVNAYGQTLNNYDFNQSSVSFTANGVGTGVTTLFSQSGGVDDQVYVIQPAGFEFWYMGQRYTSFTVSSNGWISLGSATIASLPVNSLSTSSVRPPIIAPLWDDLAIFEGVVLTLLGFGSISYKLEDVAGSGKVLTVQWYRAKWDKASTNNIGLGPFSDYVLSFQAKLYGGTGDIVFNYGQLNAPVSASAGASVGISSASTGSANTFMSLDNLSTAAVAGQSMEITGIKVLPVANQAFTFNPKEANAPTALTFTAVSTSSTTLNWIDNSTDELGFAIYRSTDNVNFSYISQTSANVTSFVNAGLTANTTYYYRVHAIRENLSSPAAGTQATLLVCSVSQVSTTNIVAHYKMNGSAADFYGANNGTLQAAPSLTTDRYDISNSAYSFNGTSQYISTATAFSNPNVFTISIWFKTTVAGGKLIGFGRSQTGPSLNADRHLYIGSDGKVYFGAKPGGVFKAISSASALNDGNWHMATATMSTGGIALYIDGVLVAQDATTTAGEAYGVNGYWRLAYDNLDGWPGVPSNRFFTGSLDDAYIYSRALTGTEILKLFRSADDVLSNAPVCIGLNLNLAAPTIAGATYSWTGPAGFTSSQQNPSVAFASNRVGVYTVTVSFGGCTISSSTRVIGPTIVGQWTGSGGTDWTTSDSWCNGVVPNSVINVTIPASLTNYPTVSTDQAINNLTIATGASVAVTNSLSVAGAIVNNGSLTVSNGRMIFNGTVAQSIPVNAFAGNLIKDLTISNSAGVTLNGSLRLTGLLTATAGAFDANGHLTLASSQSATAQVAPITGGASIRGQVKVERFVQGGAINLYRTNRMLSSPVYDNTTNFINTDLEGNRSAKFSQLIDDIIISGPGGASKGFDPTVKNEASAWTYASGFVPVLRIDTAVNIGKGMYVYFRGNRDSLSRKVNAPYMNPENVVIDFDGVLNQGNITLNLPAGNHFLGNPYAATIDWDSPNWGSDRVNVNNAFWIWNPVKRAYATYIGGLGSLGASQYISSGQSFFAQVSAAGSIKFKESIKATAVQPSVLLMSANKRKEEFSEGWSPVANVEPMSVLRIAVKPIASYGEDETVIAFKEGSNLGYTTEDALHIDGEVINISTLASGRRLAINFLPSMPTAMEIGMNVSAAETGSYVMQFNLDGYYQGHTVKLKDNYMSQTVLVIPGSSYAFNVNRAAAQTFGAGRFSLIVEPPVVLPVGLLSFSAKKQTEGVMLNWTTSSELGLKLFRLYRAGEDGNYVALNDVFPKGVGSYALLDATPLPGYNYYKLKQIDLNGEELETKPIAVNFNVGQLSTVTVYPNPVKDRFFVKIDGLMAERYKLSLYDLTGKGFGDYSVSKNELEKGYEVDVLDMVSGLFFLKIEEVDTRKIIAIQKLIKH